ncbi:Glycyl-tRNA synthetase [hydrothermal vent metagenome]|uniref:Glycyl-tRNA synthetase n=1 Tax=hydrothermal vent metagenome TaxID=652676 RepID=A0A3B0V773_9ZZZZ
MEKSSQKSVMETIVSLAKRRGFVFPGSEIYGGLAGVYDFGPRGVELLNNLKRVWWDANVSMRENWYGLDSGMFKNPRTWEASGHTSGFSDPLAECKKCNTRIRVDKVLEAIGVTADEKMSEEEINALFDAHRAEIACKKCGEHNFSAVRKFNLLVKSNLGDFTSDEAEPVYLPGEASQGIYLDYKNIVDSMHPKIPFGVAQIGKAFRNEISPRNFLFRTREFEQADTQLFIKPNENKEAYESLKKERMEWYLALGIRKENLRFKQHENLVFYAKDAWDIEYKYPWGFDELEGIHDRSNYDLTQHQKFSGVDLRYVDPKTGEKYTPWILETSMGLGRLFLAVLTDAYYEDTVNNETRVVLKLSPKIAPVKAMVSPLLKNKPALVDKARKIYEELKKDIPQIMWDDNGNIGKRYRRQDEIGTPFCITIDFDTLGEKPEMENTVTLRHRDNGEQERIHANELVSRIRAVI